MRDRQGSTGFAGACRYARCVPRLRPVILSGGSGTRLWPLSTPELPKQFIKLFDDKSLFAMTLERLQSLGEVAGAIIVTGASHLHLVETELAAASLDVATVLVEPLGRNTAPAAVAAALAASPGDLLMILPSDHLVADVSAFQSAVAAAAVIAGEGGIVTFGIRPDRPETGYGYIEIGEPVGGAFAVRRFREKPDAAEAAGLAADGRHLWNSGMFVTLVDHLIEEASSHCPDIVAGVRAALPAQTLGVVELGETFGSVESISIDHAIMERTRRSLVLPVDFGWSDVGSYRSLLEASDLDVAGNHVIGDVVISDVSGSIVIATSRHVVVAGLGDVVVVETPDAVLVVPIDRAQGVRQLHEKAKGT